MGPVLGVQGPQLAVWKGAARPRQQKHTFTARTRSIGVDVDALSLSLCLSEQHPARSSCLAALRQARQARQAHRYLGGRLGLARSGWAGGDRAKLTEVAGDP